MLFWTEKHGLYVLHLHPYRRSTLIVFAVAALFQLWPFALMFVASVSRGSIECGLYGFSFLALFALVMFWHWYRDSRWLEIPVRRGPIRWGSRGGVEGETAAHIERFEILEGLWSRFMGRCFGIVGVFPDGTRIRVLDSWKTSSRGEIEEVVAKLNDIVRNQADEVNPTAPPWTPSPPR